jgi:maltose alpha-D-glucosyltransferase/alpha-amylase
VRSFLDSDGDGMGDFRGLTSRLDYLQDLGVNAIWLLPFYPSPWRDDGYDISNYTDVHPAYGNLRDFRRFLREAHKRDLRVITELVINHTSNQHPWFERARRANPGTRARDYYVWSDSPDKYNEARIIFQDFESSNWTWDPVAKAYYWHRFYSHQPDLNFDSPDVQDAVFKFLDFWFQMGVDGLRLDAVPYLFEREHTNCENLPETHEFLKNMREYVDRHYEDRMLLAEANQWPEDAVTYFGDGDECHMAFHFPLMPRLFMSMKMEDRFPVVDILEQTPQIPETAQWGIFLRNHDELTLEMVTDEERDYMYRAYGRDPRQRLNLGIRRRLAPLLGNNRRQIELLNMLLFSLPGTPVIYYGDEIGMGDNVYLGDRDGVRTPMQWSSDKNAGFSKANPQRLYLPVIIDPEYHYEAVNIETQQGNASSLLWFMKRLIATRRRFTAFSRGTFEVVPCNNAHVFTFIRRYGEEIILAVINFSHHVQLAELELGDYAGYVPAEVFSQNPFPRIRKDEDYVINVGGHECFWFQLRPAKEYAEEEETAVPELALGGRDWSSFSDALREGLEEQVLGRYISEARWYRGKGSRIRRTSIADRLSVGTGEQKSWILFVRVVATDDSTGTYVLPVSYALREGAEHLQSELPSAVLCAVRMGDAPGVLFDAIYDESFREQLLHFLLSKRKMKGEAGELAVDRGRNTSRLARDLREQHDGVPSRVLRAEQSNSAILYRDKFFFKLYRKIEEGTNPDAELTRFLSERKRFGNVPRFLSEMQYVRPGRTHSASASLGLLVEFVQNEGDAWSYTADFVERYFDRILVGLEHAPDRPSGLPSLFDVDFDTVPDWFVELADGFYLQMIHLLGQRTGEMHLALSSETTDKDFEPEPFSRHYQRSVYQSLRSLLRRVLASVRRVGKQAEDERLRADIDRLLEKENTVLRHFARITGRRIEAKKIRVHGDYHLGQVLFTGRDFVIIDLEGEPARSLGERRLKYSAFRDVAGMIRSFHYAIYSRYLQYAEMRPEDAERLGQWIDAWYTYVSGVFLQGYMETVRGTGFVPKEREDLETVLDVFLLEKAVYEVGYEINNRPAWLKIPLQGIDYILSRMED